MFRKSRAASYLDVYSVAVSIKSMVRRNIKLYFLELMLFLKTLKLRRRCRSIPVPNQIFESLCGYYRRDFVQNLSDIRQRPASNRKINRLFEA
jgi:hypothetical protein